MGDNLQEELPAGEKLKGRLVNMCTINGGASTVGWVEVLDTTEEVEIKYTTLYLGLLQVV